MSGFIEFLAIKYPELLALIASHVQLTITAVFFAVVLGVPLGIFIASVKGADRPVLGFTNVMQAVPSLAALGLLVPIMGIGSPPAILMVMLYSLLPIVKNTYTGIKNINKQTVEAAHGIGMTSFQVLTRVQLPLALPVIMAGVRISSVTAVGLMTIAAYIGAGGLGNFVISGIQTNNEYLMLSGAIPACLLALLMDFLMSKVEKAVTPISLSVDPTTLSKDNIKKLKRYQKSVVAIMLCVVLLVFSFAFITNLPKGSDVITVSSKPEVEGVIMGHLVAEMLEYHTDYTIERNVGLGATQIIHSAILSGEIDVYPEYSGSLYSGIMKETPIPGMAPEELFDITQNYATENQLTYFEPYGFNNKYAMGVLTKTAEMYGLETISDLIPYASDMKLACSQEFPHRADGIPALQQVYEGLEFGEVLQFQGVLMYDALMTEQVEIMTPFTTDALLLDYDIKVLEDDLSALSNYQMATLIRTEVLEKYPDVEDVLAMLNGAITDEQMAAMNYEVVVNKRTHDEVAKEFLMENGLIGE